MKKKILHIQVLPKLSGVQKVSLEIFRLLPDNEYDKYILFSDIIEDQQECVRQFEEIGVTVLLSSKLRREISFKDLSAFIEIYKLCRKEKFDIVHTHSTKPGIVGRVASYMARVPLVVHTVHGLSFHDFVKFPTWQFYWLCEMFSSIFCDKITIVNKYYTKYFEWFKSKTSTIYNGIDFDKFGDLQEINRNNVIKKILFVGRLDVPKDPLTLIKAAKIVCNTHDNVIFTIVGDGEYFNDCNQFIELNNLSDKIKLEGWHTDTSKYYQSHDIFAMSSIYESFGLIFLEAGYYKLPIVATNVEGIPEVVLNDQTGFLCKPRDPESLAENINRLIADEVLRNTMGAKGHDYVLSTFTSKQMVNKYEQIYKNEN